MKLLTRDEFRDFCFKRDKNKCVVCKSEVNLCVHHIIERRLFHDGGYYAENGATVCEECHLECERTNITVEKIRELCNITRSCLPSHFYDDAIYDKWGNVILPTGQRLKGELFWDISVQKIIADHIDEFSDLVKYPRTYHLPWSQGMTDDDRMMPDISVFDGKRVVVTRKLDGENCSWYSNAFHARSVDSVNHPSRNLVKAMWAQRAYNIPEGWRVCGENMYATHSIHYNDLESYFYGFSIWNEKNECLNWDETLEWFELLDINHVPILYDGVWDEKKIKELWNQKDWESHEGYVVRTADSFSYKDFKRSVAKFVREKHVHTAKHWMHGQPIVPNELKK